MTNLIDDETASRYWAERESAPEAERESRNTALMDWAKAKKADQFRAEQQQAERAYTDLDGWWKENGAGHVFENDEDRLEVANRRYIANQFQQTPDQQGRYYPTYRDEYLQKTFGKSGLSETETFNLIRDSLTARKATEDALRELPGALAKGMFSKVAEGKTLDETDSWFLFQDWKDRHSDKLATLPDGWEAAMLDRAVKLQARTETMMRDLAPESKRAFDTLLAFTRPEDAAGLPPADRADVENLSKEFAKLDPQQRQDIYSTLYYAAEAEGAGMGKGFFEKVGEGIARGGVNIYDDMAMVAEDRNARENLRRLRSGEMVYSAPNNMVRRADEFIQLGAAEQGAPLTEGVPADAAPLTEEQKTELIAQNEQRLSELKALREIRQIADGTIDPIKTEMDGVMGEIVQGAYTISQSLPYMAIAAVPYVGLPAVMGALTNSNYLRMLDAYQDMDPDAALTISAAIAGPQAFIERFQANALIGRSPALNALMRKMTDVRIPIAARLAIGYGANVAYQTGQEFVQEAMPVVADQIAAAIREDMPEFDAGKAWGAYVDQMPDIFYSMLWAGLIGTGASSFRELKRNGQYERSLGELEMVGITGEAAQDIAAEQDPDAATSKFREAWDKRTPEDIQAGIAKRAAQLETARSTQQNPELPVRRIEQNQDGTLTHIIEKPDGTVLYRTNDSDAADIALVEQTRQVVANDLRSDISIVTEVRDQWLSEDPTNVAIESDTTTAQQKLEKLQAAGNVAQIEELHRRIATSPYKDTPYDQINILGEATVEDLGEMVFRGVITLNQNSRPEDAREEIHHVAVRKALMKGSVTLETLRGWLDATETALPDKFPGLVRESENDIVESLARVQRAYEDGKINAEEETNLPASFVDYIKRMLKVFKEVLQRAVALRGAFKQGILPSEYEAFLAESVGLNQQTMVDTTRERVGGELTQGTFNYSVGQRVSTDTNPYPMEDKGKWWANEDFAQRGGQIVTMSPDEFLSQVRPLEVDEASRDNIDDLKNMMQSGRKLDPLAIYADGKEDGRHRATAAKELGMDTIPVLDFRENKPEPKGNDFSIGSRASAVSTDTPSIRASNATITGPANYSIGAFHGTPHKVDKFSTEKIGTGEGAQAYGWGLYFAENKGVAEGYQRSTSQPEVTIGKRRFKRDSNGIFRDEAGKTSGSLPKHLEAAMYGVAGSKPLQPATVLAEEAESFLQTRIGYSQNVITKAKQAIEQGEIKLEDRGNLYSVELDVDDADLLDWDKPLSEQSEKVQAILKQAALNLANDDSFLDRDLQALEVARTGKGKPLTGSDIYADIQEALESRDSKAASEYLLAAGIPGIRYLDGGSRSVNATDERLLELAEKNNGNKEAAVDEFMRSVYDTPKAKEKMRSDLLRNFPERTSNYVVFDENLIKITEENGNRIPASEALAQTVSTDTNYSIGKKQDADYLAAVERGDMKTVQKMVDDAANSAGYLPHGDFRDSHTAPSAAGSDEEVKNGDADASLVQVARGVHIQPDDYFDPRVGPRYYSYQDKAGMEAFKAIRAAMDEIQQGKKALVTVFRAVPNDIKGTKLENRDWVTPSKTYAVDHGEARFGEGEYRIIKESVPAENLFWDGNDIREWGKDDGKDYAYKNTKNNRKLIDPVTYDENGNVIPLSQRFNPRSADTNYSIASQREIDRVNAALGGMNRGPDERLKVYERARTKFQGVMERNREALESLNKDTAKFRRTQLLQGLGELDAILSVFPPDIRGRVGGYTKLANIAPMDVFKDGEKISEVSGMNGALISAWMRQGMSIGQAGQQTELPPGYTTKENLSTARADRALADFFKQRIGMIDREVEKSLRKEYDAAFRRLLERTKPKKTAPGEKPKGIGADIQDLFTVVRNAVDMDAVSVAAHIAGLDAKIASGELTAEQEARAQVEAALVSLVGDWRNADADRRRSALNEATRIWSGAYAAHTQKVIQLREQREVARLETIQATGKAGELAGRKSKAIADSGLKGSWKDYILNLLNFDQVTGILFGENSKTANSLIDRQRATENAKEDGQQAKMQALEGFFTDLAGGNLLAGEQLRYNLAQPSMEVQGIKLSELEGLSAVMMWAQEDGRRHMTGELDETGKPSGAWNYDQNFVDEIIASLSPEALKLRDWLLKQYADEYGNINAVYAELNGVNLPQIRNYSPVTVQPVSAPTGQVLDPVSGSAMSGASTSPGALRTRGTAIAEPRFQDVLQTYISHTLQMEHWKAFAPYIAEANGVLRNRDVQNSVEEKGGAEARKILNAWLDYFAQGGTRDAGAHLALNQGISNVLGRASQVALIGRVSTLLVQSTQLGAALAEMPTKAYLKRMGKLLTGQLGWDAALNSPYIQRRIAQMPPVVQMAMQGLKGAKPTAIQQAGKRLGNLLSGADGLFTAGTYAITYDYHLTKAQELGLAGSEAESYARNIAERVTDRIAQPTRQGARSLYENTSTNPLARAGWAFASEARKNLALVAYSFAERDNATKMRTLAYVVALNSIASAILRSIWRDILDDEDDELFDDKYWSPKRMAIAAATEPLYGFPVLGSTAQNAIYRAFGEYQPSGTMFDVDRAINPVKRIPEYLEGDFEMRDVMRDIDMIVSAMGLAHPNIAAAASITHLAKDLFSLGDSAVDAAIEK